MFKNKNSLLASLFLALTLLAIYGCQKVPKGFISDNIFYAINPFVVSQGITTVSTGLVIDGSTTPLNVKLLAVRDMATGKDASGILLKLDTIRVFKGNVDYNDSTVALLNQKLKDSTLAPFSINSIGGRLQFTQATKFVPLGNYNFDIQVSNIRGTKTLTNACKITVQGASPDTLTYLAYNHSDSKFTAFVGQPASLLDLKITHNPAGPDKIIYVWKDKKGQYFNPSKGEITGRPLRPNWADWDPYYPVAKTDTSLEYGYPAGVPQMPIFNEAKGYSGFGTGISYYSIAGAHTDIGFNANTTFTINYNLTKGTFVVVVTVKDVVRVP
ncbi:hypothetical protein [Mucilaginibacter sp. FT3.2]|uniref:hypothetical protein n=1 Tax=Mucilaginibacter sp. FT3.2 TaxID=2723090 RepID=UPI00160F985A|nr:hypothetical protein [Mucilaginibacter sp. FT3.2]MBB6231621.1 hypothetical protein [Mucilaginibacter sp. FT3.2]